MCLGAYEGCNASYIGRVQGGVHLVQHKEGGRLEAVHGKQQRQGRQGLCTMMTQYHARSRDLWRELRCADLVDEDERGWYQHQQAEQVCKAISSRRAASICTQGSCKVCEGADVPDKGDWHSGHAAMQRGMAAKQAVS